MGSNDFWAARVFWLQYPKLPLRKKVPHCSLVLGSSNASLSVGSDCVFSHPVRIQWAAGTSCGAPPLPPSAAAAAHPGAAGRRETPGRCTHTPPSAGPLETDTPPPLSDSGPCCLWVLWVLWVLVALAPTRCVRLAVILQVLQALAQRLGGHAAASPPREGDQHQVGPCDATGPGADGTLAIQLHRHVGHVAAVLEGDGRRVAPAACQATKAKG